MNVSDAVVSRASIRAFTDTPVDPDLLRRIFDKAARAASGGNVQPWVFHILGGAPLSQLKSEMEIRLESGPPDAPEYSIYPASMKEPYRSRRFGVGEDMYALMGIARNNKPARLEWLKNNFRFFGAPVGAFCFVDRAMGAAQWSDLGGYLATLALLLREEGLDCCFQESWSLYHVKVAKFVSASPELMLFCGVSIGFKDQSAPVNRLKSQRANLSEFATFHGI